MPKMKRGMSEKQMVFVREYLIDLSATKAAIRAGYSQRTAAKIGSELLTKPHVAAAIAAAQQKRAARTEITQDRVLQELARVAFFDPRRLLNADGSRKPINELDDDTAAVLFARISDKVASLGLAMRHLGMLKDRVEHTGKDGAPLIPKKTDLTDDELAAIASGRGR